MKRFLILLVFSLALLAAPILLPAYEGSPSTWKVIPECIWAPATGGGTWVTEVQIHAYSTTSVNAIFYYGGGLSRGPFLVGLFMVADRTLAIDNILSTLDSLDSDDTFTYYGKVGAVTFYANVAGTDQIHVTAHTKNGNYGKTFPGLSILEGTTAASSRPMKITNLIKSNAYRTAVGFFNTSDTTTYTVAFEIRNEDNVLIGDLFFKTFVPNDFKAFFPFNEAGVTSGTYNTCWLRIHATSGTLDVWNRGIMCFGAIANTYTNDPAALIAYPYPWDL